MTTLLNKIAELLKSMFTSTGKVIEPFDLRSTTTLEELAKMLKTDAKINVGKANVLFQEAEKMAIYGITSNQGRKTIPFVNAALIDSGLFMRRNKLLATILNSEPDSSLKTKSGSGYFIS